jgi:hypothetical protein
VHLPHGGRGADVIELLPGSHHRYVGGLDRNESPAILNRLVKDALWPNGSHHNLVVSNVRFVPNQKSARPAKCSSTSGRLS